MTDTGAYADIHHFELNNESGLVDDDGDGLFGWYFQIMRSAEVALSELIGPYTTREACEKAALTEWDAM